MTNTEAIFELKAICSLLHAPQIGRVASIDGLDLDPADCVGVFLAGMGPSLAVGARFPVPKRHVPSLNRALKRAMAAAEASASDAAIDFDFIGWFYDRRREDCGVTVT